ncbi:hypothetical protein AM1_1457 [Acaryochloris marina MBIC11017]|uniref:Uncharacterized protein n=1 Tax=Acaryochloris marina (strain MBIC 11017) TaxID=329726 RepID=B0C7U4_ACAM1|nr:hypothetical protein AM1_1457 [Acaryochloris marina MBIC11017]
MIEAIECILAIANSETKIIPGHGPLIGLNGSPNLGKRIFPPQKVLTIVGKDPAARSTP